MQPLWRAWNFNHGQVVRLSKGAELEAETWGADPCQQSALPTPEHREEGTLLSLGGLGSEAGRAFLPWGAPATGPSGPLGGGVRRVLRAGPWAAAQQACSPQGPSAVPQRPGLPSPPFLFSPSPF